MKITFVGIGWEQLNISLLAALARQDGHEVALAFSPALFRDRYNLSVPALAAWFDDRAEILRLIIRQQPDVLAFSPLTGTYQWMLGIAADAKKALPGVKTVFGGVHASAAPDHVLRQPAADYVCVGEGDLAFPQILAAIARGDFTSPLPNTRYKTPGGSVIRGPQEGFLPDLDALPFFDKTIWEEHIRIGDMYFTMASRGCPFCCSYCFNSFFARLPEKKNGPYVRQRSVGHMLAELRYAHKRYKLKFIEFEDDIFTFNKKWLKEFLDHYKREIGVPFQCLSHPSFMDADVVRWLAEAGCRFVQMGIQSLDESVKTRTLGRPEKTDQIERVMITMRKYRVGLKVDHMFGLPGEPLSAQENARELYSLHQPYRVQTFWMNYFPGTAIVRQAEADGLMNASDIEQLNAGTAEDFYRGSSHITDPDKNKAYWAYETVFKLIPGLPVCLGRRLSPAFFKKLPRGLNAFIGFSADVITGLVQRNPDHIGYARYYLYHITRIIRKRLGWRVPPATRPVADEPHPAYKRVPAADLSSAQAAKEGRITAGGKPVPQSYPG